MRKTEQSRLGAVGGAHAEAVLWDVVRPPAPQIELALQAAEQLIGEGHVAVAVPVPIAVPRRGRTARLRSIDIDSSRLISHHRRGLGIADEGAAGGVVELPLSLGRSEAVGSNYCTSQESYHKKLSLQLKKGKCRR